MTIAQNGLITTTVLMIAALRPKVKWLVKWMPEFVHFAGMNNQSR
jgi:hypothetical protein